MKRKTFWFILIFPALLFAEVACNSITPTTYDARKIYEKQAGVALESGKVKLVSFRKVNGSIQPGNKAYKLEWEADLEFWDDITLSAMPFDSTGTFIRKYKKGDKDTIKGFYLFDKTENGWTHRKM